MARLQSPETFSQEAQANIIFKVGTAPIKSKYTILG